MYKRKYESVQKPENRYNSGTPIYSISKGLLYPIKTMSNPYYNGIVTYFDYFDKVDNIPDIIHSKENILDDEGWQELVSKRESFVDMERGSLKFSVYELSGPKQDAKKFSSVFQTLTSDVIVVEDLNGFNVVAFRDYDIRNTKCSFRPGKINNISNVGYNKKEIEVLNTAFSVFFDKSFREKYRFLNIEVVSPEEAANKLEGSGRTLFALFPQVLTVQDLYKGNIEIDWKRLL
ncbi:MAG: hypothetical protein KAS11_01405 [Candidatus Aenigmarchaeota archaeon]|nr:hypothetical protein [Candidatus Aenigmarchaeota archaeon]MCK5042787.1 hypothetical protein [Candidatus Aenigmarchaeota archaeon]MCK5062729.1 hypothetical protein [Candidatus Aenigmarchaeota archaeon]MCK5235003.1 hypothetical protein [Candidatus Aenigmarchaeota archaeon]MCK5289709.1 hypothetical protein [Candidatus Aenigmarchaeota archaeon]